MQGCVLLLLSLLIAREVPIQALDSMRKRMHGGGRNWLDEKVARPAVQLRQRGLAGTQWILLVSTRGWIGLRRGDYGVHTEEGAVNWVALQVKGGRGMRRNGR